MRVSLSAVSRSRATSYAESIPDNVPAQLKVDPTWHSTEGTHLATLSEANRTTQYHIGAKARGGSR